MAAGTAQGKARKDRCRHGRRGPSCLVPRRQSRLRRWRSKPWRWDSQASTWTAVALHVMQRPAKRQKPHEVPRLWGCKGKDCTSTRLTTATDEVRWHTSGASEAARVASPTATSNTAKGGSSRKGSCFGRSRSKFTGRRTREGSLVSYRGNCTRAERKQLAQLKAGRIARPVCGVRAARRASGQGGSPSCRSSTRSHCRRAHLRRTGFAHAIERSIDKLRRQTGNSGSRRSAW